MQSQPVRMFAMLIQVFLRVGSTPLVVELYQHAVLLHYNLHTRCLQCLHILSGRLLSTPAICLVT